MALDFFTGFDHYATADLTTGVTSRFTSVQNATIQTSVFRNGTRGLSLDVGATSYVKKTGLSNAATRILGFGFRSTNVLASAGRVIAALSDGDPGTAGNVNIALAIDASAKLEVYRGRALNGNSGGTKLGSSSTNTLSSSTWYFIEIVVTVHNSTGTVEVYVGKTKTDWIDLTGQDTQEGANAYSNAFGFGGLSTGTNTDVFDDIHCISGTGGTITARIGDVRAVAILPSTGDGALAQFTPSTGTDNGAMVDEATPNGDTDYNESTSVANIDTYAFPALSAVGTIYGLNLHNQVKLQGAGGADAQGVVRIGSTNHLGTQRATSSTYGYSTDLFELSPATAAAWTPSEVDGAEFGVKHAA